MSSIDRSTVEPKDPRLAVRRPFAALHNEIVHVQTPLRAAVTSAYCMDERTAVRTLLAQIHEDPTRDRTAQTLAHTLVTAVRDVRTRSSGVDALMHEFSLSSQEGIALMCVAEALLRIPDHQTADRLIADKISKGDWQRHLGESPSLFVNAATWGLLVTGKLVYTNSEQGLGAALTRIIAKGGEPLIRKGVDLAMRMLGNQFVRGRTISEALANAAAMEQRGYRHSYDMLGEAALTASDAERYYASYEDAIHAIGKAVADEPAAGRGIRNGPGISVKLSALHPRYSRAQRNRVLHELLPQLKKLTLLARHYNIGLNIDAEETDRLELSLDLIEALALDADLADFDGIGFVVQAYQKRAPFVIDYLADLAHRSDHKIMVRLVKGAYWDSEIKRAQVEGIAAYPVYTRKVYTDLCYLVCAQKLLASADHLYPQFATHNAQTLAAVYCRAQQLHVTEYEFQCLHGMGEALYDRVVGPNRLNIPCRIYAPVGSHQVLLAYLVRRLLENGANSSFVNRLVDDKISIETLLADPVDAARKLDGLPHPYIPLPSDLFDPIRKNSAGISFTDEYALQELSAAMQHFATRQWQAAPTSDGANGSMPVSVISNPADHRDTVGHVRDASTKDVAIALALADEHAMDWQTVPPAERAAILLHASDLLERHRYELIALVVREAGKSLPNASAEVREAIDFLRYYATQTQVLPNLLALGPVVCISPWNFPLAIFIGQIGAALAAGNVVLAKPAEQTPLIALRAVQLLHEAGITHTALQFLPGRGETVGAQLVADTRVRGVIFTGSLDVAQSINRVLAARAGRECCDIPFIAETGGQNVMIADSSALPEQVVQDVITSAFDSAGQRCSALRVLCVQQEIADRILQMLQGAMQELQIGNPDCLATDVGPVIDTEAQKNLQAHIEKFQAAGRILFQLQLSDNHATGTFVAPAVLEIESLSELTTEVFGPILHVLRYRRDQLPQLIDAVNNAGYGLTLGIHSRIDETIDFIHSHARVGNIYVNRNMIGAVVGVQPFGGEGKSGTGPKAGGPLYLKRLQRNQLTDFDKLYALKNPGRSRLHSAALNMLVPWVRLCGYTQVERLAQQYVHAVLPIDTVLLPGPTGESNALSFVPRGLILCVADDFAVLLHQLIAVRITGNIPVIFNHRSIDVPAGFLQAIQDSARFTDDIDTDDFSFQLALVEPARVGIMHTLLAARSGALVTLLETSAGDPIPLWRMFVERALCVNTAAAGGNTELMTLND